MGTVLKQKFPILLDGKAAKRRLEQVSGVKQIIVIDGGGALQIEYDHSAVKPYELKRIIDTELL